MVKLNYKNAFEVNGVTMMEEEDVTECFNDAFFNIFPNLVNNISLHQDNLKNFYMNLV